ncbi:MAG: methyltransferase domain-containing protein, partial [Acidimicrobiia bacterium]|nr:methyltransferase domain-containing protein [Acidimicrobiia bacterium]
MSGGNRIAEMYLGLTGSEDSRNHERERVHWICSQVTGPKVLEVGCSQGIVSILLAREGFDVIGTEIESVSLDYALGLRQQEDISVQKRLDFRLTDGSLDDFNDGMFDTIILAEIVEHLNQPERLIEEVSRVLRPGGQLVLTTTIGIYPDPDHKEPIFPTDVARLLAARYAYEASDFVTFPLGRFNNICVTASKRQIPVDVEDGVLEYRAPFADVVERCLLEVQKGFTRLLADVTAEREKRGELSQLVSSQREKLADSRRVSAVDAQLHALELGRLRLELERLRLEGRSREFEEAVAELDRLLAAPVPVVASFDRDAVVSRVLDAEVAARKYQTAFDRLRLRRVVRFALALAEGLTSPRRLLLLPRSLLKALRPTPLPTQKALPERTEISAKLPVSLPPGIGTARRLPYPHLRIFHWGGTPTFATVAPHVAITESAPTQDVFKKGGDMLLLEPSRMTDSDPTRLAELAAQDNIPVVLFVRTVHDLAYVSPYVSLVVTENPELAAQVDGVPVLELYPSVDIAAYNPMHWERTPSQPTVALFAHPHLNSSGNDWKTLIEPIKGDITLYPVTANPTRYPIKPADPTPTATSINKTSHRHLAAVTAPSFHPNQTGYLQHLLNLAANGTPVITTPHHSHADLFGPDHLLTSATPDETVKQLETLQDPHLRERISITTRNYVLNHHTRQHRFESILDRLNIPLQPKPTISILFVTNRPEFLLHAYTQIRQQNYPNLELITVLHGDTIDTSQAHQLAETLGHPNTILTAPTSWTLGDCLNHATHHATGHLITKMDDDDYYAPDHLTDLTTARTYSQADLVGK